MEAFKQKGVDLEEAARRNFYELAFSHCRQGGEQRGGLDPAPTSSLSVDYWTRRTHSGILHAQPLLRGGVEKALCASLGS